MLPSGLADEGDGRQCPSNLQTHKDNKENYTSVTTNQSSPHQGSSIKRTMVNRQGSESAAAVEYFNPSAVFGLFERSEPRSRQDGAITCQTQK